MSGINLKTPSGGSVSLVPENGVGNVTATVRHDNSVLASEFVAGVGRTWQDVAASRSAGVTYTNNTGRDIEIFITLTGSGAVGNQASITIGTTYIYSTPLRSSPGSVSIQGFTIPAGSPYSLNAAGLTTIDQISWWRELR